MFARAARTKLVEALSDTRVVLLNGARQVGKSTLARAIAAERSLSYYSLDDPATLSLARSDPFALVRGVSAGVVLDEVQLAPELFPAIKIEVDRDPTPGRFLLTGSANVLTLPRLSESLAGRIEIISLEPLTQREMLSTSNHVTTPARDVIASWFAREEPSLPVPPEDRVAVCRRILAGGFPEVVSRARADRRDAWFRSYITTLLQRDVRDLARIEGITEVPRLLQLLAARSSSLLNTSELSRSLGISLSTLRRYLALLEAMFLFRPLPAWTANVGRRLVRSPKAHLVDPGLAAHLLGQSDPEKLARAPEIGPLLETFVVSEIRRLAGGSNHAVEALHFRSSSGREVDLVLEDARGQIVGIEVKASASLSAADFGGLGALREIVGERFARGIVLYLGEKTLPFGDGFVAEPVSALWSI